MVELVSITKSDKPDKKMVATFRNGNLLKHTHFGAAGMDDFTRKGDEAQKARYLQRHKRNENWNDPTSAGALSRYILWNKGSIPASIADYKRRFHL
jgi:hypothetical protein